MVIYYCKIKLKIIQLSVVIAKDICKFVDAKIKNVGIKRVILKQ